MKKNDLIFIRKDGSHHIELGVTYKQIENLIDNHLEIYDIKQVILYQEENKQEVTLYEAIQS